MTCKAIREGDEMACICGLRWGINEEKPECQPDAEAVESTPYNPAVEGMDVMRHTQSLLNPKPNRDTAAEAIKELHHIVEGAKS